MATAAMLRDHPNNRTLRRWEGGQLGWFPDLPKQRPRSSAAVGARAEDEDDDDEDAAAAGGLTVLADALSGLLGRLGAKPHVFALGPASEAVGTHWRYRAAPRILSAGVGNSMQGQHQHTSAVHPSWA